MKKKLRFLAICFVVLGVLWAGVIYQNYEFNNAKHVLEFDKELPNQLEDENVSVHIQPRGFGTREMSSWYHTLEGSDIYQGAYVGTIYELALTNLSDNVISDWGFELTFPRDTMFSEGWNGDFDMHQFVDENEKEFVFENSKFGTDGLSLEYIDKQNVLLIPFHAGDYFSYTPSTSSAEVPLIASDVRHQDYTQKVIGFILYTKNITLDYNMKFTEGRLTYQLQRSIFKAPMFYVALLLTWGWMVALLVVIIVYVKMRKVQKEKEMMEAIIHEFEKDDTTSVLSRRAFLHYGQELIDKSDKKLGIAIIDIDNYVLTQHKLGEAICNEYMKYVAEYLKIHFPADCVGRFSRGKYAVLCELSDDQSMDVDILIGAELKEHSPMPDQILKVGIYEPVDKQYSIERCCDRVILALETIRGEYGQDVAYFDDTLENQVLDKHTIIAHMEKALEQQQFKVYYQPKNDTATKQIVGAEALVRWIHPEFGFMNPGRFIPVFEEKGFITKVDAYVFEQVCRDLKAWKEEGKTLVPVSVNISRKDFYEKDWINKRIAYAKSLGIEPSLLHLEITESLYSEDTEMIQENVKWLRDQGYLIELDDFGSGYSSLGLLGSLSIDILKLDITFVRNMDISGVVLESVVDMAHKLKLRTIAEGVETADEYEVIKRIGCDIIQGYYFSKPLAKEDFEGYLIENK